MESENKILESTIKNNDKLMEIVETIAVGEEPKPWGDNDYLCFYRDSAFRFFGVIASVCLIVMPMRMVTENSQLLQGSGLSLLPMCIFGQNGATSANRMSKKKNGK